MTRRFAGAHRRLGNRIAYLGVLQVEQAAVARWRYLEVPAMNDLAYELSAIFGVPITRERPWMVFGACRDADPDVFFPETRESEDRGLAICATCPVRPECLEYALETRERYGIWGGATARDRRRMFRRTA